MADPKRNEISVYYLICKEKDKSANLTLEEWFSSLGIEKPLSEQTIQQLKAEDILNVDDALKLSENDLKDLGIKLGTRKKILEGIEKSKDSPASSSRSISGSGSPRSNENLSPANATPLLEVDKSSLRSLETTISKDLSPKITPHLNSSRPTITSSTLEVTETEDKEEGKKLGKLYKMGVFYNDFVDLLSPFEMKYLRSSKNDDRRARDEFIKALGARENLTSEVKSLEDLPGILQVSASDNLIGVCSGEGSIYMIGPKNIATVCLGKQKTSRRVIKIKAKSLLEEGEKFVKLSCGSVHVLALTSNGRVFSWGYNINTSIIGTNAEENSKLLNQTNPQYEVSGQLGRGKGLVNLPGEISSKYYPGAVSDISAGGVHSGVITSEGLYMFGNNREGQLGSKKKEGKSCAKKPVLVESLQGIKIVKICCGGHHTLALSEMHEIYAWGFNNKGQLGIKENVQSVFSPTIIESLRREEMTQISAGNLHSAGLTANGKLYTWGSNDFGQLGRKKLNSNEPAEVLEPFKDIPVYQVSCGSSSTCCVTNNGYLYAWGRFAGQNLTSHVQIPRRVQTDCLFVNQVEAGLTHCAVIVDEELTETITFLSNVPTDIDTEISKSIYQHLSCIPSAMINVVQERVQEFLFSKTEGQYPIVQVDNPVITFQVEGRAPVLVQTFNLTNKSNNTVDVKISAFLLPNGCSISTDASGQIKGGKSIPVKVTLNAKRLNEECTAVLVVTLDQGKKLRAGRFFIMLRLLPENSSRNTLRRMKNRQGVQTFSSKTYDTIDVDNAEIILFEKLGSGGSGASVYRCSVNGFTCAVKILKNPEGDAGKFFKDEVTLLETLRHENIVRYLGHDSNANSFRLFMEFYPYSLAQLIQRRKGKYFPVKESKKIGFEISKGLAYLHNHNPPIIHRDLKPGNVLVALDENDDAKLVKITDFDISTTVTDSNNGPMTVAGTPIFTAPEVYSSKSTNISYTVQADIWSFGMLLYEVATLKQPYYHIRNNAEITENILKGVHPILPADLDPSNGPVVSIILSCLKLNPVQRPTASQLVQKFVSDL